MGEIWRSGRAGRPTRRHVLARLLHLIHRGAVWASGAAQAAQVVRIILRFAVSYWACAALLDALLGLENPFFIAQSARTRAGTGHC